MRWPVVVTRIGLRTAAALWRQRLPVLLGIGLLGLFSVYELTFAGSNAASSSSDCADTAMTAVTHIDEATARAAYACLGPTMRTTSEDQFVAGLRARGGTTGQFDRVADKRTPDGGRIVFYTVHTAEMPTVGYIVYLDPEGKVAKVE